MYPMPVGVPVTITVPLSSVVPAVKNLSALSTAFWLDVAMTCTYILVTTAESCAGATGGVCRGNARNDVGHIEDHVFRGVVLRQPMHEGSHIYICNTSWQFFDTPESASILREQNRPASASRSGGFAAAAPPPSRARPPSPALGRVDSACRKIWRRTIGLPR